MILSLLWLLLNKEVFFLNKCFDASFKHFEMTRLRKHYKAFEISEIAVKMFDCVIFFYGIFLNLNTILKMLNSFNFNQFLNFYSVDCEI